MNDLPTQALRTASIPDSLRSSGLESRFSRLCRASTESILDENSP